MPQRLLTGQLKEKPTYRVWCLYRSFVHELNTRFLIRFRTYKIASPPPTKMTRKDDIKGLVALKFLRPCCIPPASLTPVSTTQADWWQNLPWVLLTLVVHLDLRLFREFSKKFEMTHYFQGLGRR